MRLENSLIFSIVKNAAFVIGGTFDVTNTGVPRIIYKKELFSCSVVYCANSRIWKIFHPFPKKRENQKRIYFNNLQEVKEYLYAQVNKSPL